MHDAFARTDDPVAEYRFDQCELQNTGSEIADSAGSNNGSARNGVAVTSGLICNGIELNQFDSNDYITLPAAVIDGARDFAFSAWIQTVNSGQQSIVSGASNADSNAWLLFLADSTTLRTYMLGAINEYNIPDVADGNWHHIVWVRDNRDEDVYVDGVRVGSNNVDRTNLSVQSVIIGQEQDTVGGGFDNAQVFRGAIDEVRFYDHRLRSNEVDDLYVQQQSGQDDNGTPRVCPNCPPPPSNVSGLIAEYRFDTCFFDNAGQEMMDTTGDFNGIFSVGVDITDGKICSGAMLNDVDTQDMGILPIGVINGKTNFAYSMWFKTTRTGSQSLVSGATSSQNNAFLLFLTNSTTLSTYLNGATQSYNIPNIANDQWHHVVWTRTGNAEAVYLDGALRGSKTVTSAAIAVEALLIGQEQDTVGGGFDPNQVFSGALDEIRFYEKGLTPGDVSTLYSQQNAGQSDDGTPRPCPQCPVLLSDYRLDSCAWDGTPNEVIDFSGNGNHGFGANGVVAVDGKVCKAAQFDGINDRLQGDTNIQFGGALTMMAWIRSFDKGESTPPIIAFTDAQGRERNSTTLIMLRNGGFRGWIEGDDGRRYGLLDYTAENFKDDLWHHVTYTYDGIEAKLYVDGSLKHTEPDVNNSGLIDAPAQFSIGNFPDSSADTFAGLIDEIKIYSGAMSEEQIQVVMRESHACRCATAATSYQFDECTWAGAPGEVVDYVGTAHGQTFNGPSLADNGQICRLAELNVNDGNDYIVLPDNIIRGKSNFSVSVWFKTTKTGQQGILSGARTGQSNAFLLYLASSKQVQTFLDGQAQSYNIPDIADSQWHQLVWVREDGTETLYLDAVNRGSRAVATTPVDVTSLMLAQEQDTVGGGFDPAQVFSGQLDELRFWDGAIRAVDVVTYYNNNVAKLNDDGSARDCAQACPVAVGWWKMDQCAYNGNPGQVLDSSGNGFHGDAINGTVVGNGMLCQAGSFDGVDDKIQGTLDFDIGGTVTMLAWFKSPGGGRGTPRIVELSDASGRSREATSILYNRDGSLRAWIESTDDNRYGTITYRDEYFTDDQWHLVAYTYDGDKARLYIDGQLKKTVSSPNPTGLLKPVETFSISGAFNNNSNSFLGQIDEVRVYRGALLHNQIATMYANNLSGFDDDGSFHACAGCGGIDHFQIVHDQNAINCQAEQITIRACADVACTTLVTGHTGTITLSTSSSNGTWSKVTGNGNVTDNTADDGAASYEFTNEGEVVLALYNTHQESVNITVDGSGVSDDDTEGLLAFRPIGFEISPAIGNQVAGKTFTINMNAVGFDAAQTGCTTIAEYTGTQAVDFWFDYSQPTTGTRAITINGNPIGSSVGSATSVSVNFNSGAGSVSVNYADVGQVQLFAKDDTGVGDPVTGTQTEIVGGANPFWVMPWQLSVEVPGNVIASDANGPVFKKAGENFDMTVRAVVWESADDVNSDLAPDTGADLSNNSVTPNFSNSETITLSASTQLPVGGGDSALSNGTNIQLTNGVATITTNWNEVGIVTVDAGLTDANYLSSGLNVIGQRNNLGRFVPDHFDVQILNQGSLVPQWACGFAYIGQTGNLKLSSIDLPELLIRAETVGNTLTSNYQGAFNKLSASTMVTITPSDETLGDGYFNDGTQIGTAGSRLAYSYTPALASLVESDGSQTPLGTIRYTFGEDDFVYLRNDNARVNPFVSDIELTVSSIVDADGVALKAGTYLLEPLGTTLKFGRLQIDSAQGSEKLPLAMEMRAEHYNNNSFVTNQDDNCTFINASDLSIAVDPPGLSTLMTLHGSPTGAALLSGDAGMVMSAPNAPGYADIQLAPAGLGWLTQDWLNNPQIDDWPTGRASFGVFGGQKQIIYQREVFN